MKRYLLEPARRLKKWEVVFLVGCGALILLCGWLTQRQTAMASRMVRLHVVANSDSNGDQALKLQVRDAVLAEASSCLDGVSDVETAKQVLNAHLNELADVGAAVVQREGYSYPVSASLEWTHFPTKDYDGFSLPAGDYQALRIVIGDGAGHNWWCVVFPSLCVSAASEFVDTAVSGGLTEDDIGLMTEENEGYVLRFKCLEWFDMLKSRIA